MVKSLFTLMIRVYQRALRPVLPPSCRFYPSCSDYALAAIERAGPVRGGFLALRRVLRCHPWNPGGYDPVVAGAPSTRPAPPGRAKN